MANHVFLCLSTTIVLAYCSVVSRAEATSLDDYILKADSHYRWHDTGKRLTGLLSLGSWEGAVLNMTSQRWLSSADVDCSIWTHDLVIVKPRHYDYKRTALLIIGGGSNTGDAPSATDELVLLSATVAVRTRSLVAALYQVPNQPCHFTAEQPRRGRSEDDLIAYTWAHFLDHTDQSEWPLRLPMTKAVVRAMDTVQAYADKAFNVLVENFVVTGASKRGWTTWTTAAIDERVVGIIPIVMDALNFLPNIHHFYRSLGGWPIAFEPYYAMNLTSKLDSPGFKQLMDIVDPYSYRERLNVPKLMVSTSNDEFFLLDDSAYFWDDLPGEKHILILSNTEHSLLTGLTKLVIAVEAFFLSIVEDHEPSQYARDTDVAGQTLHDFVEGRSLSVERPGFGGRPKYSWYINQNAGTIDIGTSEKPLHVYMWYAYTTKGTKMRDFRWFTADIGNCPTVAIKGFCINPLFFHRQTLRPSVLDNGSGKRNYYATIAYPKEGYGAFFVEFRFAGPKLLMPFIFTTAAVIVPNHFPVEDCHGESCKGVLV